MFKYKVEGRKIDTNEDWGTFTSNYKSELEALVGMSRWYWHWAKDRGYELRVTQYTTFDDTARRSISLSANISGGSRQ